MRLGFQICVFIPECILEKRDLSAYRHALDFPLMIESMNGTVFYDVDNCMKEFGLCTVCL